MPDRTPESSLNYRYGFQGQEQDDEWLGGQAISFKYRVHDPRIGKFLSLDPLASNYSWNSPYAFSENRVIDSYELEGLEKVSIHNYSFAPFDIFGFGFHGDGNYRNFGDPVDPSDELDEGYRSGFKAKIDLSTMTEVEEGQAYGSYSLWSGTPTFSDAELEQYQFEDGNMSMHVSGSNKELFIPAFAGDIDVHMDVTFKDLGDNKFNVSGKVFGDRFPSNESYLTDVAGNQMFLGVSGISNSFNGEKNLTPAIWLWGDGDQGMQNFNLNIIFNEDETFKGVELNDGTFYNVDDWNNIFKNLDPKSTSTGTNVTNDKVETKVVRKGRTKE